MEIDDEEEIMDEEEEDEESDDFVIFQEGSEWVVTRSDGDVLGTFEGHESALIFIAQEMSEVGGGDLYWRNDKSGELEFVEGFDPELFLRKAPRGARAQAKRRRPRGRSVGKYGRQTASGSSQRRRRRRRGGGADTRAARQSAHRIRDNIIGIYADLYPSKEEA